MASKKSTSASAPTFQAELKKQGTRLKGWAVRRCTVSDKTLTYSHRFGGSQSIKLSQDTLIHLDGNDVHVTGGEQQQSAVFRAPNRRLAMQLKAALLHEIGWQKGGKPKAEAEVAPVVAVKNNQESIEDDRAHFARVRSMKICQAAADGATDTIHRLAITEDDINSTVTGASPLHWACFEGKVDAVKQLLKLGAEIGHEDQTGMTPGETCVYLGSHHKRAILNVLARKQLEHRRCGKLLAHFVHHVHSQNGGVTLRNLNRIIIDFCIGRHNFEALRDGGDSTCFCTIGLHDFLMCSNVKL